MCKENNPVRVNVFNVSEMNPSWNWLSKDFHSDYLKWSHYSTKSTFVPRILPKKQSFSRLITAKNAVSNSRKTNSVIVSHGPRPTFYTSMTSKLYRNHSPHLAYSFNFTNLPQGIQHKLMIEAYQQPTKFVVFSSMEKRLYADYFDIDENKIDMIPWSIHTPSLQECIQPIEPDEYICAVGSQGRDYELLFAAMRKIQKIKLVLVATPESIRGLNVPPNVKVYTNIPLADAQNIISYSKFMVLPLRDSQVPCGHVTLVSAMFYKKAILITDSEGIHDYIQNNKTGRLFEPHNPDDLSRKIQELWESPNQIERLARSALKFAQAHCTERTVVNYFQNFLNTFVNN